MLDVVLCRDEVKKQKRHESLKSKSQLPHMPTSADI